MILLLLFYFWFSLGFFSPYFRFCFLLKNGILCRDKRTYLLSNLHASVFFFLIKFISFPCQNTFWVLIFFSTTPLFLSFCVTLFVSLLYHALLYPLVGSASPHQSIFSLGLSCLYCFSYFSFLSHPC